MNTTQSLQHAFSAFQFPHRDHYILHNEKINNIQDAIYWLKKHQTEKNVNHWHANMTLANLYTYQNQIETALNLYEQAKLLATSEIQILEVNVRILFWRYYQHQKNPQSSSAFTDNLLYTFPIRMRDFLQYTLEMCVKAPNIAYSKLPLTQLIVLGQQVLPNGNPTPDLICRLQKTTLLAKQYPDCHILVSGKGKRVGFNEAAIMKEWLQGQGIDKKRIQCEKKALTTLDNARYSLPLLSGEKQQIGLITSSNHMTRSLCLFQILNAKSNGFIPLIYQAQIQNQTWAQQNWLIQPRHQLYPYYSDIESPEEPSHFTYIEALKALGLASFEYPPFYEC